jgi:hypothetical protein
MLVKASLQDLLGTRDREAILLAFGFEFRDSHHLQDYSSVVSFLNGEVTYLVLGAKGCSSGRWLFLARWLVVGSFGWDGDQVSVRQVECNARKPSANTPRKGSASSLRKSGESIGVF